MNQTYYICIRYSLYRSKSEKDAISCKNNRGLTPFHCAIENIGESQHSGLATIEFVAAKYPFVLNEANEKRETPLIFAIEHTRASQQFQVIRLLATEKAVTMEDYKGQLVRIH